MDFPVDITPDLRVKYGVMYARELKISKNHHLFLFGARGTGKTTYLEYLLKNERALLKIDLLDIELEEKYALNPKLLIQQLNANEDIKYVLIDEIQKLPKLLDIIHQYIHQHKNKTIFILTGSSAKKLKQGGANLLAGRAFVYNLFPLAYTELQDDFDLDRYLEIGGLPEVYSFNDRSLENKFLKTYALTYLKEEVWAEHLIKNLDPFRKFLEMAANANGEIINYSKMSKQIGVDSKTVQSYFQILEETLVAYIIEPFSTSIRKRLVKSPRFYLFDPGVQRALSNTLSISLKKSTYAYGRAFEHFIITQILFKINYLENDFSYYYLKTESGVEIDLVLQKPDKEIILIEIKSSDHVIEDDVKHLNEIGKDLKNSKSYLLSQDKITQKIGNTICLYWREGLEKLLK